MVSVVASLVSLSYEIGGNRTISDSIKFPKVCEYGVLQRKKQKNHGLQEAYFGLNPRP